MKKILTLLGISIMCLGLAGFASGARAASLSLVADKTSLDLHESARVVLMLDTQDADANAIEGTILFPADRLTVRAVSDANSVVTFWVTAPQEKTPGKISFSGIMPGGFKGASGTILSFEIEGITQGTDSLQLDHPMLLANDGEATPLALKTNTLALSVSAAEYTGPPLAATNEPDADAPEPFVPLVGQDTTLFGGKYFVAFSTVDKGSGIDRYEIVELPAGTSLESAAAWQPAQSPQLLTDQKLASDIYIKAIDHAGNSAIGKIPARFPASMKIIPLLAIFGAIIVLLLIAWLIKRASRRRR